MVWLSFLPPTTTLTQTAAQARFKLPKVKSFKAEASNYLSYNLLSSLKNSCRQKSQGVPINLTMHYAFCACFNKIMTKYPKDLSFFFRWWALKYFSVISTWQLNSLPATYPLQEFHRSPEYVNSTLKQSLQHQIQLHFTLFPFSLF